MSRIEKDLGFGNAYFAKLNVIPDDRLKLVADYLDVSVDYLITGEEKDSSNDLIDILDACRDRTELRVLFKLAKDCPSSEVNQAIAIIRALRNND